MACGAAMCSATALPVRLAATFQPASRSGIAIASAAWRTAAFGCAGPAVTGSVSATSCLPGMQILSHISQVALAFSSTSWPGFASAGTVIVTGR